MIFSVYKWRAMFLIDLHAYSIWIQQSHMFPLSHFNLLLMVNWRDRGWLLSSQWQYQYSQWGTPFSSPNTIAIIFPHGTLESTCETPWQFIADNGRFESAMEKTVVLGGWFHKICYLHGKKLGFWEMTGGGRAVCFPHLNGAHKKKQAGITKNGELPRIPWRPSG